MLNFFLFPQDIVKYNKFELTTRLEAANIEYPPVIYSSKRRLLTRLPNHPTQVTLMVNMPSRFVCEDIKDLLATGEYQAVSCQSGTLTAHTIEVLIRIHELHDVKTAVISKQQWLAKKINTPNSTCSYAEENSKAFATMIFDTPDGCSVLKNNKYILASDMATVAGNGWLHFSVMTGISEILDQQNSQTVAFMLNNIIVMNEDSLNGYINTNINPSIKRLYSLCPCRKSCRW